MWDSTNIDKAFTLNIHQTILRIYFLSLPLISFLTPFPLFFSLQMFDAYCVLILMPMQQAYIPFALFWWSCYCFWSVSKSSERKKMNKILTHTHGIRKRQQQQQHQHQQRIGIHETTVRIWNVHFWNKKYSITKNNTFACDWLSSPQSSAAAATTSRICHQRIRLKNELIPTTKHFHTYTILTVVCALCIAVLAPGRTSSVQQLWNINRKVVKVKATQFNCYFCHLSFDWKRKTHTQKATTLAYGLQNRQRDHVNGTSHPTGEHTNTLSLSPSLSYLFSFL